MTAHGFSPTPLQKCEGNGGRRVALVVRALRPDQAIHYASPLSPLSRDGVSARFSAFSAASFVLLLLPLELR